MATLFVIIQSLNLYCYFVDAASAAEAFKNVKGILNYNSKKFSNAVRRHESATKLNVFHLK